MFLPTTKTEMEKFGWDKLDIILVTGDTYIDSPYIGTAIIANLLYKHGFKVGVLAQPDILSDLDIARLGEPELFWGISAGSVDSMVANYTASKKRRKFDDFTPGGDNVKRPDRATIVYANLIRRYFKNTKPLVLGGIEASLRRIAHYDFWSDSIKRSILFDAKADILVYGMAEKTTLELALRLKAGSGYQDLRGLCYISKECGTPLAGAEGSLDNVTSRQQLHSSPDTSLGYSSRRDNYIVLPSHEAVKNDNNKFIEMFKIFYDNNDAITAKGLCQIQDTRYLVQNPPSLPLSQKELDEIHDMTYTRDVHPYYRTGGPTKAIETIRFSIASHRGCYGECNFCSIAVHQGRNVVSRSESSILKEALEITKLVGFKGYISDVGGPTANMYMIECAQKAEKGSCKNKRCLYPKACEHLPLNHGPQMELLNKIAGLEGVKKVFVASGIRYDMVMEDKKRGIKYLENIVKNHISGQLKIAPEHATPQVLKAMGKPGTEYLKKFKNEFNKLNNNEKDEYSRQYLTYYIIAAHPGCTFKDMLDLKEFARKELKITPEQVQVFTPLPSTYSALMYHTGIDPFTGKEIFVEKDPAKRDSQKAVILGRDHYRRPKKY